VVVRRASVFGTEKIINEAQQGESIAARAIIGDVREYSIDVTANSPTQQCDIRPL
jgi:hypothetical protein